MQPHRATHSHTQPHTATHSHTQPHKATHSHTHKVRGRRYLICQRCLPSGGKGQGSTSSLHNGAQEAGGTQHTHRNSPPATGALTYSTCATHAQCACPTCKCLRRTATDCCRWGHDGTGDWHRQPMSIHCQLYGQPAYPRCALMRRGVAHRCGPGHHTIIQHAMGHCACTLACIAHVLHTNHQCYQPQSASAQNPMLYPNVF